MIREETEELIVRYFDGAISPAEFDGLQEILRSDTAALRLYMEHSTNHSLLEELYHGAAVTAPAAAAPIRRPKPAIRPSRARVLRTPKRTAWGAWAAAACVVLAAGLLAYRSTRPPAGVASLAFRDASIWHYETADGGRDSTNSGRLEPDRVLNLEEGSLRAVLASGVETVIKGPAVLRLENENILHLENGRGWFSVQRSAQGFEVVTPQRRITDLGTQFGVLENAGSGATEVHVFKGLVTVEADKDAASRELSAGNAVAYDAAGEVREIAVDPDQFLQKLPEFAEVIFTDDFESENVPDGQRVESPPPNGWTRIGNNVVGTFNPDAEKVWYKNPKMADSGATLGEIGAMKGPAMAYFYLADRGEGMVREVAKIEPDSIYSLSFAIGERPAGLRFGGYTASLMCGDTELATISSESSPGGPESVELVNLRWDGRTLPAGVLAGDPLSIRFTIKHEHYLDIDNVRLVRIQNS